MLVPPRRGHRASRSALAAHPAALSLAELTKRCEVPLPDGGSITVELSHWKQSAHEASWFCDEAKADRYGLLRKLQGEARRSSVATVLDIGANQS